MQKPTPSAARPVFAVAAAAAVAGGLAVATPAAADAAPTVVINEIESNGDSRGDWVELANTDAANSVDVTGWTLIDDKDSHEPIVLGGEIESGGYLAVLTEPSFGLGGGDSVTLRDADGAVVDAHAWAEHSATTLARCPDMTGDFADSAAGTYELANDCGDAEQPSVEVEPWPYGNEISDAVAVGTWGDDMSGIDIAVDGTVYAVNNDAGEISRLAGGPDLYRVDETWQPAYPDGAGTPDGEGIAVDAEGAVYLATERNNDAKDVSRPSVLRYELGAGGAVTATGEWNLAELTGQLGANGGAEAIEWISDEDALAAGLDYDPAAYGEHFGGIFAVGIEQTGAIHVVVLEADGGITQLQRIDGTEAVSGVMGLDWRDGGNQLFAQCDEACDNRSAELRISGGRFERVAEYAAPTGMNPSYTNEGLAMSWCDAEPETTPTVLWMSDAAHQGVSLRAAAGDCTDPGTEEPGDGDGSADGGATDGGATDGGATDGGATDDGAADGGETDDGATDGGADDGAADGGATDDGSTDGGATDGGAADGGATDDGMTDGGATDDGMDAGGMTDGMAPDDGGTTDDSAPDGGSGDASGGASGDDTDADRDVASSGTAAGAETGADDGELAVTGAAFSPALPLAAAGLLALGVVGLVLRRRARA